MMHGERLCHDASAGEQAFAFESLALSRISLKHAVHF